MQVQVVSNWEEFVPALNFHYWYILPKELDRFFSELPAILIQSKEVDQLYFIGPESHDVVNGPAFRVVLVLLSLGYTVWSNIDQLNGLSADNTPVITHTVRTDIFEGKFAIVDNFGPDRSIAPNITFYFDKSEFIENACSKIKTLIEQDIPEYIGVLTDKTFTIMYLPLSTNKPIVFDLTRKRENLLGTVLRHLEATLNA